MRSTIPQFLKSQMLVSCYSFFLHLCKWTDPNILMLSVPLLCIWMPVSLDCSFIHKLFNLYAFVYNKHDNSAKKKSNENNKRTLVPLVRKKKGNYIKDRGYNGI